MNRKLLSIPPMSSSNISKTARMRVNFLIESSSLVDLNSFSFSGTTCSCPNYLASRNRSSLGVNRLLEVPTLGLSAQHTGKSNLNVSFVRVISIEVMAFFW